MPNDKWYATFESHTWYEDRTEHQGWIGSVLWQFLTKEWALNTESSVALARFLSLNEDGFYVGNESSGWHFRRKY